MFGNVHKIKYNNKPDWYSPTVFTMAVATFLKNSDFWTALAPIYILLKLLGAGQFIISGSSNNRNLKTIHCCSLYKITSYVGAVFLLLIFITEGENNWIFEHKNALHVYTRIYSLLVLLLLIISTIFANVRYRSRVIKLFEDAIKVDRAMWNINAAVDNRLACNLNIFSIVTYIAVAFILLSMKITALEFRKNVANIIHLLMCLYKSLISILYRGWIFSLSQRFSRLHNCLNLTNKKNMNEKVFLKKFAIIRSIYYNLCDMLKELNELGFVPTVINFTANFSFLTIHCYYAISTIQNYDVNDRNLITEIKISIFNALTDGLEILLMISFSYVLAKQV